jgi:hypothetical protein
MEVTMNKNILRTHIGKKLPWFAAILLCLAGMPAYAGDLTTDSITVNRDATIRGSLQVLKGSAPTNGLILYYNFDTNTSSVSDESGNYHTGTVYGATWTTNGISGGAYSFDGSNDYIDAGTVVPNPYFTMSAWVKYDTNANWGVVVSRYNVYVAGSYEMECRCDGTGNANCLSILYPASGGGANTYGSSIQIGGKWTHIATTWDGTTLVTYINGISYASTNLSGVGVNDAGVDTLIGSMYVNGNPIDPTSEEVKGSIDEVRIYNRALSASEISGLYYYNRPASENYARFEPGVSYIAPLGDLGMGVYQDGQ